MTPVFFFPYVKCAITVLSKHPATQKKHRERGLNVETDSHLDGHCIL